MTSHAELNMNALAGDIMGADEGEYAEGRMLEAAHGDFALLWSTRHGSWIYFWPNAEFFARAVDKARRSKRKTKGQ